jgi:DNA-binding IclR family transcriptional regulator
MTDDLISPHQLKVFDYVRQAGRWVTAAEIQDATGVAMRTARHHASKLTDLGLFEQVSLFPGHRYRVSPSAEQRNKGYMLRLAQAREVFGGAA